MNNKEAAVITSLLNRIESLEKSNREFQKSLGDTVAAMQTKVERPIKPFELQETILSIVQKSMTDCIKTTLTGYSSPLTPLITNVVHEHNDELKQMIRDAFSEVIRTEVRLFRALLIKLLEEVLKERKQ